MEKILEMSSKPFILHVVELKSPCELPKATPGYD